MLNQNVSLALYPGGQLILNLWYKLLWCGKYFLWTAQCQEFLDFWFLVQLCPLKYTYLSTYMILELEHVFRVGTVAAAKEGGCRNVTMGSCNLWFQSHRPLGHYDKFLISAERQLLQSRPLFNLGLKVSLCKLVNFNNKNNNFDKTVSLSTKFFHIFVILDYKDIEQITQKNFYSICWWHCIWGISAGADMYRFCRG